MSRKKKHPDAKLFDLYEAFHVLFLELNERMENEDDYDAWKERDELQTAQWVAMIDHITQQEAKTPAGLALLGLACLHAFDFRTGTWDGVGTFQKWDGYSLHGDLNMDCPMTTAFARITEYALALAPEVKERANAE